MSEHEAAARAVKVDKLIEALCIVYGATPDPAVVAALSDDGWRDLEAVAHVRPASEVTRNEVARRLAFRLELKSTLKGCDPFDGFPTPRSTR